MFLLALSKKRVSLCLLEKINFFCCHLRLFTPMPQYLSLDPCCRLQCYSAYSIPIYNCANVIFMVHYGHGGNIVQNTLKSRICNLCIGQRSLVRYLGYIDMTDHQGMTNTPGPGRVSILQRANMSRVLKLFLYFIFLLNTYSPIPLAGTSC